MIDNNIVEDVLLKKFRLNSKTGKKLPFYFKTDLRTEQKKLNYFVDQVLQLVYLFFGLHERGLLIY
jgi:hypothetical protein